jgi:uncharacterized protein (TIGR02646 family)
MRLIRKEPHFYHHALAMAHQNPPQTSEQANSRWSSFGHKPSLIKELLKEQYYLCAYSEIRTDLLGLGTHIEHIAPKSQNPSRTFDYQNLVACALSDQDLKTIAPAERFGGHKKLGGYDAAQFISCLEDNCAHYFVYLSDGRIVPNLNLSPTEQANAQYSIDLLNLNCSFLLNRRKRWLEELDALIDEHLDKNHSLTDLAAIDLLPCSDRLSPFFTATRQRFGRIAEQVLQTYPALL